MSANTAKILIVEDDTQLNLQMTELFSSAGYGVESCFDGNTALAEMGKQHYQLLVLDLMLPQLDGISLLRQLRGSNQIPVIIVSAKGAEEERILGLKHGADDYISKPFNPTELLLRMEALLRRCHNIQAPTHRTLNIDQLQLNRLEQEACFKKNKVELTPIQFNILWELALHQGQVLSKAYLSQTVLHRSLTSHDRGLDMHVCRVRRKLKESGWDGNRLQTVHGNGYCLK